MVIEHHVPEVPYGQVQLADGLLDRPGRAVIAHQPHHGFEGQSRQNSRPTTMSARPAAIRS